MPNAKKSGNINFYKRTYPSLVVTTFNFELKNYLTPKTYLLFVGTKHKQECSITSLMIE